MEIQEKQLNEKESLQLIHEMITAAKTNLYNDGYMYLLWGWFVFIASLLHYFLMVVIKYEYSFIVWPILMTIGGILSFLWEIKKGRTIKVVTYIDISLKNLCIAFLISLFMVLIFGFKLQLGTYPVIIIIYGTFLFLSGGIIKFKPLVIGGIINWIIAIPCFFVTFDYQLLLLALAVLLGYIIPGHLLNKRV